MVKEYGLIVFDKGRMAGSPGDRGTGQCRAGLDRWQRVWIEFEYESRNFLKHFHDASKADIIVCWTHNWPECPLPVIELKELVKRLG